MQLMGTNVSKFTWRDWNSADWDVKILYVPGVELEYILRPGDWIILNNDGSFYQELKYLLR